MAKMARAGLGQSQELCLVLPCVCRGPSTWTVPKHISKELDYKIGAARSLTCANRMLALWVAA